MYCRRCRYPLTPGGDHRCPECGTQFDPTDSNVVLDISESEAARNSPRRRSPSRCDLRDICGHLAPIQLGLPGVGAPVQVMPVFGPLAPAAKSPVAKRICRPVAVRVRILAHGAANAV